MRAVSARYPFFGPPAEALARLQAEVPPTTKANRSAEGPIGKLTGDWIQLAWRQPTPRWMVFEGQMRADGEHSVLEGKYQPTMWKVALLTLWLALLLVMTAKVFMQGPTLTGVLPVSIGWIAAALFVAHCLKTARQHVRALNAFLVQLGHSSPNPL